MRIAEHNSDSADVAFPVTNWDEYLSGWDLGDCILQLIIETFVFQLQGCPRYERTRTERWKLPSRWSTCGGEFCQRCAGLPWLWPCLPSVCQMIQDQPFVHISKKNLNLHSLPFQMRTMAGRKTALILVLLHTHMSTLCLKNISNTSAILGCKVPSSQVTTLSLVLVLVLVVVLTWCGWYVRQ